MSFWWNSVTIIKYPFVINVDIKRKTAASNIIRLSNLVYVGLTKGLKRKTRNNETNNVI